MKTESESPSRRCRLGTPDPGPSPPQTLRVRARATAQETQPLRPGPRLVSPGVSAPRRPASLSRRPAGPCAGGTPAATGLRGGAGHGAPEGTLTFYNADSLNQVTGF